MSYTARFSFLDGQLRNLNLHLNAHECTGTVTEFIIVFGAVAPPAAPLKAVSLWILPTESRGKRFCARKSGFILPSCLNCLSQKTGLRVSADLAISLSASRDFFNPKGQLSHANLRTWTLKSNTTSIHISSLRHERAIGP
jgi:hypothetical protein